MQLYVYSLNSVVIYLHLLLLSFYLTPPSICFFFLITPPPPDISPLPLPPPLPLGPPRPGLAGKAALPLFLPRAPRPLVVPPPQPLPAQRAGGRVRQPQGRRGVPGRAAGCGLPA